MCFNIAVSRGGLAFVATDQRHGIRTPGRPTEYHDLGAKLFRLGAGLVTVTGETGYLAVAVERMAAAGVDAADIDAVSRWLRASAASIPDEIAGRWPHISARLPKDNSSFYLAAPDGEVAVIDWHGGIYRRGREKALVSFPHEFRDQAAADKQLAYFSRYLEAIDSPFGIVRAIAAEFAGIAAQFESVSSTVEIAWGDDYLTGVSRELALASDDEIRVALTEPPALDITALAQTCEMAGAER